MADAMRPIIQPAPGRDRAHIMHDESKMARAEVIIGYVFHDKDILWEVLQSSNSNVTRAGDREIAEGNKRMAQVGDRIAEHILTDKWYSSGQPRGKLVSGFYVQGQY